MQELSADILSSIQSVFTHAAVGMAITDFRGRYVAANDAFCRITGYQLDELLTTDFITITHPDYRISNVELARRLHDEEVPAYVIQKEYIKKSGNLVWVQNSVTLLRNNDGKPVAFITLCQDITERKVIQSALDESEERFRLQFKATPVPIFSWRAIGDDFVLVDYNDAADRMTNHGIMKLLGRRASQLYVDTPEVVEGMKECFGHRRTIRKAGDFCFLSTGELKQLEVSFVYVPPDRVMIHTEDVSERKRAEEARLEAERKYREIFENANEGIFQSTPEGRFLTVNPALARMLRFDSPEQLISERTNIASQHFVDASRREEMKNLLATAGFVQAFEFEAYRRDGSRLWVSESIRAVRDVAGTILYYEGITEDITERKHAENDLRTQKEILQEIFDHIPVMITFVDRGDRVKHVNLEFERVTGWTQREIAKDGIDIFAECYPDQMYRQGVLDFLVNSNGEWAECQALTKDGRLIDTTWAVVRLSDGTAIGIGKDITAENRTAKINNAAATLSHRLSGALTPRDAATMIAEIAAQLFSWEAFNLQMYDSATDRVQTVLAFDTIGDERKDVTTRRTSRPPTAQSRRVLANGAELIIRHVPEFENKSVPFGDVKRPSASIMTVPIRYAKNVVGLLSIHSYQSNTYSEGTLNDLQRLADICGEAMNRIRAEQSLYESEERFRQIAENMDDIVWIVDAEVRNLLYINPAYERICQLPVSHAYERIDAFVDSVYPEDRKRVSAMIEQRIKGNHESVDYRIVRSDESVRWVRSRSFPIKDAAGKTYRIAGVVEDITDQKRAEMELRSYSRRLVDLQETERMHLARELHDEIGQVLTAVRINLQGLEQICKSDAMVGEIRDDIRVIDEALKRVRDLSFELRPSLLDDLGLAAATRWYVDRYAKRAGIKANVEIDFEISHDRLPKDVETACFRILQEALSNVARHARAQSVDVTLSSTDSYLWLSVKDDGIGTEATAMNKPNNHLSTLGIRGMEERALAVAGELRVISAPSSGTEVRANFPVLHQRDGKLKTAINL